MTTSAKHQELDTLPPLMALGVARRGRVTAQLGASSKPQRATNEAAVRVASAAAAPSRLAPSRVGLEPMP